MIRSEEHRWVFWAGIWLGLITTLPYLLGFFTAGPDWRYTGLLIAAEDGSSYLAKMALGASGDWLFRTPYSVTPQSGFLAFLPYLILGKLAAPPGQYEQLVVWFHLFRFAGDMLLAYATYRFVSLFLEDVGLRRMAALLAVLGGGLGFLSPLGLEGLWQGVMKIPLEFYSPETFGFLSALALPHLAWARALLLLGLVFFVEGLGVSSQSGGANWMFRACEALPNPSSFHEIGVKRFGYSFWRSGLKTGFAWVLLGFMQPLTVVSAWVVVGTYLLLWAGWLGLRKQSGWQVWKQAFRRACLAGVLSGPLVLYNFLAFQLDPFLKRWQAQNLIPSPPPGDYLLAFGVVLPLAVWAGINWRTLSRRPLGLPFAWVVAFPFLAYAPYNLQRRFPEGIWVALSILAITGFSVLPQRWRKIGMLWVGLGFFSSLILFAGSLAGVSVPQPPLFRPLGEVNAMNFLAGKAQKGDVVLAAYDTSTVLPTRAPVRVLIGHGPESLGLAEIQPVVEDFYRQPTSDTQRQAVLKGYGVRFVFWGPLEQKLGDWNPASFTGIELVFDQDGYQIYQCKMDK